MNKIGQFTLISLFIFFIFSFCIVFLLSDTSEYSYWENRTLAQKPELTLDTIQSDFSSSYENYFTDQFPLRDTFVYSYIKYQQLTNQTYIQNHYIDEDLFVYPKPLEEVPYEQIDVAAKNINQLADYTLSISDFLFFYMPNRIVVLHENYPSFLKGENRVKAKDYLLQQLDEEMKKTDLNEMFMSSFSREQLKKLYYQTDHHWNAEGALAGFYFIRNTLLNESLDLQFTDSNYVLNTAPLDFLGSYNRQIYSIITDHQDEVNYYESSTLNKDELKIYLGPVADNNLIPYEQIYHPGIYLNESPIMYDRIFTNDYKEVNLVYPNALNDKKVLIIKDSYTNAISLLLAEQFTQTTLYDVRHNQDRDLYDFLAQQSFDLVLLLTSDVSFNGTNFNFEGE